MGVATVLGASERIQTVPGTALAPPQAAPVLPARPRTAPDLSLRPLRSVRPEDPPAGDFTDIGLLTRRPPEDGLSMAIPWENERFRRFRQAYLTPGGRRWLETLAARSVPYAAFVYESLRRHRLPEELFFLPVIESEWSPHAVSRSGAKGLWQFMRNSIAGFNMRVDDWVDERRDFMKSTEAALRKLRFNYEALGSWEMALAAYNCGLGAARRAVAAGGTWDYWELSERGLLPPETISYVPKFLAAVSVLGRAGRNGLALPEGEPVRWERVELDRPVDLALLAEASG
ncbi:MAG TPA: lytic transglycosylase domain-containing protein, partial [Magnetospirillaceae bacterium]|nr:lytic transglycosylase domain-containing protein [Magnetospirillaceae bacterium]